MKNLKSSDSFFSLLLQLHIHLCDTPFWRGFSSFAPAVEINSEQRLSKLTTMLSPEINSYCAVSATAVMM